MKVKIQIDTRTFVRFWLVLIGFALVALAIYSARTALLIVGVALFLALALNAPVSWMTKRLPGKSRTLSTAISFLVVVLFLGFVVFLVIPPIVQQTIKFVDTAPATFQRVSEQWSGAGELIERYHIQPQVDQAVESFQQNISGWVSGIGHGLWAGFSSAMSFFVASLIVLVMAFFMLVEGPAWLKRLWGMYTDRERRRTHKRILGRMYSVFTGYVSGQLTVSGIGALAAGATVFILSWFFQDLPANLTMPTVAVCFVLSLIPMFGATIAGVIVSILIAFNSIPAAIIFAIYFVVYQQVENNIISPKIQSKRIELSPLAVLVAVTIGIYVFGLIGGIVSIPVAGCVKVLLEEYTNRRRGIESVPNPGFLKKFVKKSS